MTTDAERARELAALAVFGRTNVRYTSNSAKRERFERFQLHVLATLVESRTDERERAARIAEDHEAPVISDAIRRQEG